MWRNQCSGHHIYWWHKRPRLEWRLCVTATLAFVTGRKKRHSTSEGTAVNSVGMARCITRWVFIFLTTSWRCSHTMQRSSEHTSLRSPWRWTTRIPEYGLSGSVVSAHLASSPAVVGCCSAGVYLQGFNEGFFFNRFRNKRRRLPKRKKMESWKSHLANESCS